VNVVSSSQALTLVDQSRKREGPTTSNKLLLKTDKSNKKPRVQQVVDRQFKVYELITTAVQEQQEGRQSSVIQKAIQLLQEQYKTRLSPDGFDSAVEVLEQKGKATIFITLSGNARDRWLQKNANTKLDNKELI
jgi:hypothetical protein